MNHRPHRNFSSVLLAVAALLAIGGIVAWFFWKWTRPQPSLNSPVLLTSVMATPNGQVFGFGYPKEAFEFKSSAKNKKRPDYKASFLRWNINTRRLESQQTLDVKLFHPTVSPDNKKVAFITRFSGEKVNSMRRIEIRHLDQITSPGISFFTSSSHSNGLSWTPDSRSLIVHNEKINIYDATSGDLQRTIDPKLWQGNISNIAQLTFSPDAKHVAIQEAIETLPDSTSASAERDADGGYIKGRLFVATWPQLKLVDQLPGDLWTKCIWDKSSQKLQGMTRILGGHFVLQVKVASYDLATRKTHWVVIQPPTENIEQLDQRQIHNLLIRATLTPNGHLVVGNTPITKEGWPVWNASTGDYLGQIGASMFFPNQDNSSTQSPIFTPDSRYLLHPNKRGVEIWDLTRFAQ